jgi:hypothetical protein
MIRSLFYADVLGFGALARTPGAGGAADALSQIAYLFSQDELVRFLGGAPWTARYGLSDSLFLVADDPVAAGATAAELFFHLAYVSHVAPAPVLLRGAVAIGEVREVGPIFPETATANLIGEAVVRAAGLEKEGPKGPRLLLADEAAAAWRASVQPEDWLLDQNAGQAELLWLLPPDPATANGLLVGEVCRMIFRLAGEHGANPRFGYHYLGFLDLAARSLQRLLEHRPEQGETALRTSGFQAARPGLEQVLTRTSPEAALLARLRDLVP